MYTITLRNTVTDTIVMPEALVDQEGLDLILKRVTLIMIEDRIKFIEDLQDGNKWRIDQYPNSGNHYQLVAQLVLS